MAENGKIHQRDSENYLPPMSLQTMTFAMLAIWAILSGR